jgi:hypothetical protein
MLAHLWRRWSLSGREGFGFLSLPPSLRGRIQRFLGNETPIFHCARREETEENGGHRGDRTLDQTRSLFDRTRPVSAQRLRVSRYSDRTRWHVRSRPTRHVRSLWVLTGLKPDAGTMASGSSSSASGRWLAGALLGLTSTYGQLRDQRVRSSFTRGKCATSASGQRDCSKI